MEVFVEYIRLELILENWKTRCCSGEGGECQKALQEEQHRDNPEGAHQVGLSRDLQVVPSDSSTGRGQRTMVGRQAGAMELGFVLQVIRNQGKFSRTSITKTLIKHKSMKSYILGRVLS